MNFILNFQLQILDENLDTDKQYNHKREYLCNNKDNNYVIIITRISFEHRHSLMLNMNIPCLINVSLFSMNRMLIQIPFGAKSIGKV